jgi:hypothetical protein
MEKPIIILGESHNGKPVTLYKCFQLNYSHSFYGLGESTYCAHIIFDGVHFPTEKDIKFRELYGSYFDLDGWVNINGFSINKNLENDTLVYDVRYKKPKKITLNIDDNFSAGIGFSAKGPNWSRVQTDLSIEQKTYFFVKSIKKDIELEIILQKLNVLKDLLQIGIQRIPLTLSIVGHSTINMSEQQIKENAFNEIDIYFQPIEVIRYNNPKIPNEMLFVYADFTEDQITNWFSLYDKYHSVINLYRGLFYQERLFIDIKFLNIAEALESLHNILFENQILTKSEFNKRKDIILKSTPQEYQEWLVSVFLNANYKQFQLKILELIQNKQNIIGICIDDFDCFSKKVRDTRNQFVHNNEKKFSFKSGNELFEAINILSILFESYLLELMGFSEEKIVELLEPKIQSTKTGWRHLRNNVPQYGKSANEPNDVD